MADPKRSPPLAPPPSTPGDGGLDGRPPQGWMRWILPLCFLAAFFLQELWSKEQQMQPSISYSQFYERVAAGQVGRVSIVGQAVEGRVQPPAVVDRKTGTLFFRTRLPAQDDPSLIPLLRDRGVQIEVGSEEPPPLLRIVYNLLPWVLILGVGLWLSSRTQRMIASRGPFGGMMRGRSHRFEQESGVKVRFDDVAGLKAAKNDLQEIVEFLKSPERFRRLGGAVPRGVLLVGPPGTGKTLLARAVAGEAGVPFFSISASEFVELFVGMGASRVRELFAEAKKVAPAIIFIDEIDAVGRARGTGIGGGNDEREQTLNQLLSEMDGFTRSDLTIVLAATNRPDVLDMALLRPGRFDRRVIVDRPELQARMAILAVHTRNKPLTPEVDLKAVASMTPGFSGADLANLANEAALYATRRGADAIGPADFSAAYDKIVLGDPREAKLDEEEKKRIAVHEAGHSILAYFTPQAELLERVTIIPRGMALGVTQQTPQADRHILTHAEANARLRVLMGGYAAEQVVLADISSGAENDLKKATELAFKMVANYGMSERLGPIHHAQRYEHGFLGDPGGEGMVTSDATAHLIEEETRRFLADALTAAKKTISERRGKLDMLVAALLERETVERAELTRMLGAPNGAPERVPSAVNGTAAAHLPS